MQAHKNGMLNLKIEVLCVFQGMLVLPCEIDYLYLVFDPLESNNPFAGCWVQFLNDITYAAANYDHCFTVLLGFFPWVLCICL